MNNNLNIITLNIPYPPDYGGMIDTFYRIKSLQNLGVKIHLHCFEYGRSHSKELESLCETINYYSRKSGLLQHFSLIPYIVSSRKSISLLDNLMRNDYPIFFDGLHSTYYVNHPGLSGRKRLIRMHNVEHIYYRDLADNEINFIKKAYFLVESLKLKRYEKVLGSLEKVLAISGSDNDYFNSKYHNSELLPPFHPFNKSECLTGSGDYLLYHGDLSVNENALVADSLISSVFSKISYLCIIAGKNPPQKLLTNSSRYSNIRIISNPGFNEMKKIIQNAHIHLLPALSSNGFKLKLMIALFAGRHCMINSIMADSTNVGNLCHIADSSKEIIYLIRVLMQKSFTEEMILERSKILSENYSNLSNAKKLLEMIFND